MTRLRQPRPAADAAPAGTIGPEPVPRPTEEHRHPPGARADAAPPSQADRRLRRARVVLDLAMRAGELMLRSGAETSRVEETVNILVRGFGLAQSQCLVTPTGIYLSVDDPRLAPAGHAGPSGAGPGHALPRIAAVNDLSRRVQAGVLTLPAARRNCAGIEQAPDPYPLWLWLAAGGASAAGMAVLLGGDLSTCSRRLPARCWSCWRWGRLPAAASPRSSATWAGPRWQAAMALGLAWRWGCPSTPGW